MDEENHYPALIYYIEPSLYKEIEKKKVELLGFLNNEVLREIDKSLVFDFKYNPTRKAIGFFVKKDSDERLILHETDLEERLRGLFNDLHKSVVRKIDPLRIHEEVWR